MVIDREFIGYLTDVIDGLKNTLEAINDKQDEISFANVSYLLYQAAQELDTIRRSTPK